MMKKTGSRKSRWTVPLSIYVQIKGRIRIGPKKSDPDLRTTILVHRHNDYEYEKMEKDSWVVMMRGCHPSQQTVKAAQMGYTSKEEQNI